MKEHKDRYFDILALLLGVGSILCSFTPMLTVTGLFPTYITYIPFLMAAGGLILGVLSRNGKRYTGFAVAGMVLCLLGLILYLVIFYILIDFYRLLQDPQAGPLLNEQLFQIRKQLEQYLTQTQITP